MKNKLTTAVRFAVAGIVLFAGVAVVNTPPAQANTPQVQVATNAVPVPLCDPNNPHCTILGN